MSVIKKTKEGPRHVGSVKSIYAQLQTDLSKQIFLFQFGGTKFKVHKKL